MGRTRLTPNLQTSQPIDPNKVETFKSTPSPNINIDPQSLSRLPR